MKLLRVSDSGSSLLICCCLITEIGTEDQPIAPSANFFVDFFASLWYFSAIAAPHRRETNHCKLYQVRAESHFFLVQVATIGAPSSTSRLNAVSRNAY